MGGMLGSEHLAEDLFARLARLIVHPDFRTDISQQIYRGLGVAGVEIARKMLRKFLKEVEG
jgi:ABC-type ATPase with predicted acetyltransferase domain